MRSAANCADSASPDAGSLVKRKRIVRARCDSGTDGQVAAHDWRVGDAKVLLRLRGDNGSF